MKSHETISVYLSVHPSICLCISTHLSSGWLFGRQRRRRLCGDGSRRHRFIPSALAYRLFFSHKRSSEASPSSAFDRASQIPDEYLIDLLYSAESLTRRIDPLGSAPPPPSCDWGNVSMHIKSFVCLGKSIFIVFPLIHFHAVTLPHFPPAAADACAAEFLPAVIGCVLCVPLFNSFLIGFGHSHMQNLGQFRHHKLL